MGGALGLGEGRGLVSLVLTLRREGNLGSGIGSRPDGGGDGG